MMLSQRGGSEVEVSVVLGSGNANNAATASVCTVNANNGSANANQNIGRQLAVSNTVRPTPSPRGEYVYPIQVGRATEDLGEQQQ